jgi:hypothetical protein
VSDSFRRLVQSFYLAAAEIFAFELWKFAENAVSVISGTFQLSSFGEMRGNEKNHRNEISQLRDLGALHRGDFPTTFSPPTANTQISIQ